jgi:hypothetical protein
MALFRAEVEGKWDMKMPIDERTGIAVNCMHKQIKSRLNSRNACYPVGPQSLASRLLSKI